MPEIVEGEHDRSSCTDGRVMEIDLIGKDKW